MTELSLAELTVFVERSQWHVIKQEQIIDRLTEQGHTVMAEHASEILVTMRSHLALEIKMLARMTHEAQIGQKS